MERIDLTTPETKPTTTFYTPVALVMNWESGFIEAHLRGENSELKVCSVVDPDFLTALNKARLDSKSLHRRVMERLIADNQIDGTISGLVD